MGCIGGAGEGEVSGEEEGTARDGPQAWEAQQSRGDAHGSHSSMTHNKQQRKVDHVAPPVPAVAVGHADLQSDALL